MNRAIPAVTVALLFTSTSWAETERQLHAHEHGHGELHIVATGSQLQIELHSPLDNLLGFEHKPMNEAEEEAVHEMEHTLEEVSNVLTFDRKARCKLVEQDIDLPEGFGHEHEDHDHDAHEHEDHHDEHADHEEHDHDHHDEHAHEGHDHEDTHSEISATWTFECQQQPKTITVKLFESFTGFNEVDAEAITSMGAVAVELSKANPEVKLP